MNSWTINNYPLPLISDLINNIGKKVVFLMSTIMFFGLTNLLVTFQIMMNDLLRNIIEVEDIVVFINNVMVEMEIEKRHDDIIEEVLRKMAENDLFVKPEKYM